jgi:hypothetical protein
VSSSVARWYIFKPKSPIWVNFEGLSMEDVCIFMTIWSVLLPKVTFYVHLVHFVVIWYIFPRFGLLYREKSGNPGVIK